MAEPGRAFRIEKAEIDFCFCYGCFDNDVQREGKFRREPWPIGQSGLGPNIEYLVFFRYYIRPEMLEFTTKTEGGCYNVTFSL